MCAFPEKRLPTPHTTIIPPRQRARANSASAPLRGASGLPFHSALRPVLAAKAGQIIAELIKAGVTPEQAQEYLDIVDETDKDDSEIKTYSFLSLAINKIPPEQIKKYTNRFTGRDISGFIEDGIKPEQVLAYPEKLRPSAITALIKAGIDPERTRNYPGSFDSFDIYQLASKNITPETVNKYPPYMASKIIELIEAGVSPEAARKQYDKEQNEGQKF